MAPVCGDEMVLENCPGLGPWEGQVYGAVRLRGHWGGIAGSSMAWAILEKGSTYRQNVN